MLHKGPDQWKSHGKQSVSKMRACIAEEIPGWEHTGVEWTYLPLSLHPPEIHMTEPVGRAVPCFIELSHVLF